MLESRFMTGNKVFAWIKAARMPSFFYLLPPFALGLLLACKEGAFWSESLFSIGILYIFFLQLFIVFANDLADVETDELNENPTIFSGGSRVLVHSLLSVKELITGSLSTLIVTIILVCVLAYKTGSVSVLGLGFMGPFLLWIYSYEPFKLSYRGGGELLQALGLSFVLPLLGFKVFGGNQLSQCLLVGFVSFPTQLACAMTTAIPDAVSDAKSHKNTFVVMLGPGYSCLIILSLHILSDFLAFLFLAQGLLFSGIAYSLLALVLPQLVLITCLILSFFRRSIFFFVFFSIAHVFSLVAYFIWLTLI